MLEKRAKKLIRDYHIYPRHQRSKLFLCGLAEVIK